MEHAENLPDPNQAPSAGARRELPTTIAVATPAAEPAKKKKKRISPLKVLIALVALTLAGIFGTKMLFHMMTYESTDDAFLTAHVHSVASRVTGTVVQVLVDENQKVKKGDVLVKLDQRDYLVAVRSAQANYSKAHKDLGRFHAYINDLGPTDKPVFDQYQASALVSEAELTKAQLQLEYTNIVAAEDGKIGRRSVETGEMIQPGQALMALVEPKPWIVANFKEHQVAHMRVGQPVEISIDAIPDKVFTGKVESIAPGSGSTFSLLPPDNATGNFTKIVQRIPVRIQLDDESVKGFEDRLVPGMSTEVDVKVK